MIEMSELVRESFFWVDTVMALYAAFILCLHLYWFVQSASEYFTDLKLFLYVAGVMAMSTYILFLYNSLYSEVLQRWLLTIL